MLLRRTTLSKRLTTDQIESRLRDVLLVLKYVSNKDVFMLYHKAHLTRRQVHLITIIINNTKQFKNIF